MSETASHTGSTGFNTSSESAESLNKAVKDAKDKKKKEKEKERPGSMAEEEKPKQEPGVVDESSLEMQLTHEKLRQLEQIFEEADEDGEPGLDIEEFRGAMRTTLGRGDLEDEELDMIFMKMDVNCDGTVDWEEYLSYMLLEAQERDVMSIEKERIFPKTGHVIPSEHRDGLVTIQFYNPLKERLKEPPLTAASGMWRVRSSLKSDVLNGRYLTASCENVVTLWDCTFEHLKTLRPTSLRIRTVYLTSAVVIPKYEVLFLATTGSSLLLYHILKDDFSYVNEILKMPECPVILTYHTEYNNHQGMLITGTDRGSICVIKWNVNIMNTVLNSNLYISSSAIDTITFDKIIARKYESLEGVFISDLHIEPVREIMYLPTTDEFITSSRDDDRSMCLCDNPDARRKAFFSVIGGISTFDYSRSMNMIISGGFDAMLRVWNANINTKPVLVLTGHQNPIVQVRLIHLKEQVVSVDIGREVRLYDLNLQTCLQVVDRNALIDMGIKPVMVCHFHPLLQRLVIGSDKLGILDKGEDLLELKHLLSHDVEVGFVKYNPLFNKVVSAAWDSLICVWNLADGEKIMQFKAHSVNENGLMKDYEVTALNFDPTYRRLLTAGRDGNIKVWNFNNGAMLRVIPTFSKQEITSIIFNKTKILTGGWNKRVCIYVDDPEDDTLQWLFPYHSEDITSMALHEPAQLFVSSAYNGDMYVWAAASGRMLQYINHKLSDKLLAPYSYSESDRSTRLSMAVAKKALEEHTHGANRHKYSLRNREPSVFNPEDVSANLEKQLDETGMGAIVKIVCISDRALHPETASLFTAAADGYIRAWSIHNQGGLIGKFYSGQIPEKGLSDMVLSTNSDLLLVADITGHVKVWFIEHYAVKDQGCTEECQHRWQECKYWKLKKVLEKEQRTDILPCYPDPENLHLLAAFRAHMDTITSLDYIYLGPDHSCMVTGSLDRSVRLWTVDGQFIGIVGQPHLWNIANLTPPIWREDISYYWKAPSALEVKVKGLVPIDLLRGCDMQNMFVLKRGYFAKWQYCVHRIRMYLIRTRAESIISDEIEIQMLEKLDKGLDVDLGYDSSRPVMGKYNVVTRRTRPKVRLDNPLTFRNQVPVFRSLPLVQYKAPKHPMADEFLRGMRRQAQRQPLECNKGIGRIFQKVVALTQTATLGEVPTSTKKNSSGSKKARRIAIRGKIDMVSATCAADLKTSIHRMRRPPSSTRAGKSQLNVMPWKKLIDAAKVSTEEKKKIAMKAKPARAAYLAPKTQRIDRKKSHLPSQQMQQQEQQDVLKKSKSRKVEFTQPKVTVQGTDSEIASKSKKNLSANNATQMEVDREMDRTESMDWNNNASSGYGFLEETRDPQFEFLEKHSEILQRISESFYVRQAADANMSNNNSNMDDGQPTSDGEGQANSDGDGEESSFEKSENSLDEEAQGDQKFVGVMNVEKGISDNFDKKDEFSCASVEFVIGPDRQQGIPPGDRKSEQTAVQKYRSDATLHNLPPLGDGITPKTVAGKEKKTKSLGNSRKVTYDSAAKTDTSAASKLDMLEGKSTTYFGQLRTTSTSAGEIAKARKKKAKANIKMLFHEEEDDVSDARKISDKTSSDTSTTSSEVKTSSSEDDATSLASRLTSEKLPKLEARETDVQLPGSSKSSAAVLGEETKESEEFDRHGSTPGIEPKSAMALTDILCLKHPPTVVEKCRQIRETSMTVAGQKVARERYNINLYTGLPVNKMTLASEINMRAQKKDGTRSNQDSQGSFKGRKMASEIKQVDNTQGDVKHNEVKYGDARHGILKTEGGSKANNKKSVVIAERHNHTESASKTSVVTHPASPVNTRFSYTAEDKRKNKKKSSSRFPPIS